MADTGDSKGVLVFQIEKHAVLAAAKTKTREWRFQFFYIPDAVGEVTVHAVKNLQGRFAVDGAKLNALPATRESPCAQAQAVLSFLQAELAQNFFMWDAFTASERSLGELKCRGCFGGDLFLFHRNISERQRHGVQHGLEHADDSRKLPGGSWSISSCARSFGFAMSAPLYFLHGGPEAVNGNGRARHADTIRPPNSL